MIVTNKADKISYSAWNRYHACPYMYHLHYNERLRPVGESSALLFGKAIDDALNSLLLKETDDPVAAFQQHFKWEDCKNISWHEADLDWDLFSPEQRKRLKGESDNYAAWACMRIKGRLMLEAYVRDVLPRIEEVHDVQLETGPRRGFIDAVLSIKGVGKSLVDHKTTSRPYKRGSVAGSVQLALYAGETGISSVAFITLVKQIRKNKRKTCRSCGKDGSGTSFKTCNANVNGERCHGDWSVTTSPESYCQIISDTFSEADMALVQTSFDETETAIRDEHFPKNLNTCHNYFGKKCPYFHYCRHGIKNGLETKNENT